MSELVTRHRLACAEFSRVAALVAPDQWERPTPCSEWDARALVEHVIGFHDFLLLRPMGVRANRPRTDEVARWEATRTAIFTALDPPGALDQATDLPGGGQSTPRTMLGALTTEMLVHAWDLARATDQTPAPEHRGGQLVRRRLLAMAHTCGPPSGTSISPVIANPRRS